MWTCVRFCIPCDSTNGRRIYWNVLVKTNQDLPIFIKPIVDFHHHMCVISLPNKNKNYHNVGWYFCSARVGIIYLWCRPYKYKDYLYHVCEFWLGLSRITCVYCISTMQIVMANTFAQLMWALYLSDVVNTNVDSRNTSWGWVLAETFTYHMFGTFGCISITCVEYWVVSPDCRVGWRLVTVFVFVVFVFVFVWLRLSPLTCVVHWAVVELGGDSWLWVSSHYTACYILSPPLCPHTNTNINTNTNTNMNTNTNIDTNTNMDMYK